jgi:hypothetical protein
MKQCENCERVIIQKGYDQVSSIRVLFGLFFIYLPAIFLPVVIVSGLLVYTHLLMLGARNLKTLSDFLPDRGSHRYSVLRKQVVHRGAPKVGFWTRLRLFWFINCTFYCPVSVGVLEWNAYLVKVVENWWCPFEHEKKAGYANAAIDGSYWHNPKDIATLVPEDRENPIWNEESSRGSESKRKLGT